MAQDNMPAVFVVEHLDGLCERGILPLCMPNTSMLTDLWVCRFVTV